MATVHPSTPAGARLLDVLLEPQKPLPSSMQSIEILALQMPGPTSDNFERFKGRP